jgi:hypothetical protein
MSGPGSTRDDVRAVALGLPETEESAHFGKTDFRVRGRIFATLPEPGRMVVKLTPEDQAVRVAAAPEIYSPVSGAWGAKGWTSVALAEADRATLESALTTAWRTVAPKPLVARRER